MTNVAGFAEPVRSPDHPAKAKPLVAVAVKVTESAGAYISFSGVTSTVPPWLPATVTANFVSLGVEPSYALHALTQMQRRGLVTMSRSKQVGAYMQHWFVFNEKHLDIDLDAIEASGNAA
jgi:hypothetical protein